MNIAVGSLFRNMEGRIKPYMDRIAVLSSFHNVRLVAVEGDSTDRTRQEIQIIAACHKFRLDLRTCNHGGRVYGSTEDEDRMVNLSKVVNECFEGACEEDEVFLYVESDLVWDPYVLDVLIRMTAEKASGYDIFAPMPFHSQGFFYDTWGFRKNGARFGHCPPYHELLQPGLVEVDSAGSCLAMSGRIAQQVRILNSNCLVGWCEAARSHGHKIAVHSDLRIVQP